MKPISSRRLKRITKAVLLIASVIAACVVGGKEGVNNVLNQVIVNASSWTM